MTSTPSLSRVVTGGALWMGGSLGLQVVVGLVAQVVLAGILTPRDFGLFALTVSVSLVLTTTANFGIATLMAQRTPREIAELRTPVFRAGMWASAICCVALAVISPLAARLLNEPDLQALLLVTAVTFLLKPYTAIANAMLQARLRFARVAWVALLGAVAHYVVAIVLAEAGAGAMSLVIGLQVSALVQPAMLWILSRGEGESRADAVVSTKEAAAMARWPLAGEVAIEGTGRIDFLMLGLFVSTEVVGVYYFAFSLVVRLNRLYEGVTRNVLFPALAQISEHRERQQAGVRRAGLLLALGGGAVAAALIASLYPIEEILWGGRWEAAVPAMMLLSSVSPGQGVQAVVEQLLKARAHFRRWTAVIAVRALGGAVVALVTGAVLGDDATATAIAVPIVVFLVLEAIVEVAVIGGGLGISARRYWAMALPVWAVLVGGGWAVVGIVSGMSIAPWPAATLSMGLVGLFAAAVALVLWRLPSVRAMR
jgi:O-antigen/teichoic acid export membrane protein